MTYSLGIWAIGSAPGGTLYRWEADSGASGSGFVVFDALSQTIWPCDSVGEVQGDLVIDAESGNLRGAADGINRVQFLHIAAAIMKAYAKLDDVPQTANVYFA